MNEQLRQILRDVRAAHQPGRDEWEEVDDFYARRDYEPAWLEPPRRDAALVLIEHMTTAADDGLRAADYDASAWMDRLRLVQEDQFRNGLRHLLALDVELSAVLVRYASDLAYGAAEPERSARQTDVIEWLALAHDAPSAGQMIAAIEPQHPQYSQLRQALRAYRAIALRGGWRLLPEGMLLVPAVEKPAAGSRIQREPTGAADGRLRVLRLLCDRLIASGDLDREALGDRTSCGHAAPTYDAALAAAVRRFQSRHGLVVDGIVGPRTLAALNVPVDRRIRQLVVNMDRWRRLPDDLGDRHVFVNIAGFRLNLIEHGQTVGSMRVVAGAPDRATPLMRDEISYLEFRPYWNVPDSITHGELLPRILENPTYLEGQRLEVIDGWDDSAPLVDAAQVDWEAAARQFPYRLRQKPGPQNAMGLVKFMFPNDHSVYLHDTPATHRFESRHRAFSHGCVRVEHPVDLAEFLLRGRDEWSRDAITSAMQGDERRVVPLGEPVPVHLTYFTAWLKGQEVEFRPDVYGLDAHEAQLSGSHSPEVS